MKVNYLRPEYSAAINEWRLCRNAADKRESVEEYLLPLTAGVDLNKLSTEDKNRIELLKNEYIKRAVYYNAVSYSLGIYLGLVFRKKPEVKLSPNVQMLIDSFDGDDTLLSLATSIMSEILKTNRALIVGDMPKSPRQMSVADLLNSGMGPQLSVYSAESVINWPDEGEENGSFVLVETFNKRINRFEIQRWNRYRVLFMLDGVYHQETYVAKEYGEPQLETPAFTPTKVNGNTFDYIPAVFADAESNDSTIKKPFILDLAEMNIAHYRNSADYEHGLHLVATPTPYLFGVDPSQAPKGIGAGVMWCDVNSDAKAGFVEFMGAGMSSLLDAMKEKIEYMATLGTKDIIGGYRIETATGASIRHVGQTARLSQSAESVSNAIEIGLDMLGDFISGTYVAGSNKYRLQTDYNPTRLDPQMITSLFSAVLSGNLSQRSFIEAMQSGEVITDIRTVEQEMELIKQEREANLDYSTGFQNQE
jgi:hypothetical protein